MSDWKRGGESCGEVAAAPGQSNAKVGAKPPARAEQPPNFGAGKYCAWVTSLASQPGRKRAVKLVCLGTEERHLHVDTLCLDFPRAGTIPSLQTTGNPLSKLCVISACWAALAVAFPISLHHPL